MYCRRQVADRRPRSCRRRPRRVRGRIRRRIRDHQRDSTRHSNSSANAAGNIVHSERCSLNRQPFRSFTRRNSRYSHWRGRHSPHSRHCNLDLRPSLARTPQRREPQRYLVPRLRQQQDRPAPVRRSYTSNHATSLQSPWHADHDSSQQSVRRSRREHLNRRALRLTIRKPATPNGHES